MTLRQHILFSVSLLIAFVTLSSCNQTAYQSTPTVAAGNSLLECVLHDLLGSTTPVLRLTEPGMCPGHFDIRPSQFQALQQCRLLVQLDFQQSVSDRLPHLQSVPIVITGGLCEPASYLSACRQTAEALVSTELLSREQADRKLSEIKSRISQCAVECQQRARSLEQVPILASVHQEAFCKWLGLNVVATFSGADTAGTSQLDHAVQAGVEAKVRMIVANLPEGRQIADRLAERLGAEVVVFGNFPSLNQGQNSFDDLLQSNVALLLEASQP